MNPEDEQEVTERPKVCSICAATLAWADLPGQGRVWHCDHCLAGPQTIEGTVHRWQRVVTKMERRDRQEIKVQSTKPCPECRRPMLEIQMRDFGSRWQCEHCRLTVFSSGGIQRWSKSK